MIDLIEKMTKDFFYLFFLGVVDFTCSILDLSAFLSRV